VATTRPTRPAGPVPGSPESPIDRAPAGAPIRAPAAEPASQAAPDSVDAVLARAVSETARLLRTDGAMAYLLDESTGILRFAHDAGITDDRRRAWVRSLKVDSGVGMFGRSVAAGVVVSTGDYPADESFVHFPEADRLIAEMDIHSFVVAPLVSGGRTYGAMGTFSSRIGAFGDSEIALVRALADHAAAAMANADLIDELASSRSELERRADAERALREIGGRIIALRYPAEVLQRSVDEAARLLGADGARIDLLNDADGGLYWAYDATTGRRPGLGPISGSGEAQAGEGISGRAVRELRAVFTGDYLADDRFEHAAAPDDHARRHDIRSAVAVPLIGDRGPLGTLTVYTHDVDAFDEDDARLIEALAGQAAIAMTNARLIEELARSRAEFRRRADAERALREIAARITAIHDPSDLLQDVVDEAARLLGAQRARIDLIVPAAGRVGFVHGPGAGEQIGGAAVDDTGRPFQYGAAGKAFATGQTIVSTDYQADDGFEHDADLDEAVRRDGIRSLIVTPLSGEEGLLGVLQVGWTEPGAFDPDEVALVEAFAHQAAIAIHNARLIEALATSREETRRRARAEQALREIAASISAIRDPDTVLQQTVDQARWLLDSDSARIDMLEGDRLVWAFASGDDAVQNRAAGFDRSFRIGEGAAGLAVQRGEAFRTGDYLADSRFPHVDGSDELVVETGYRSVLSTPLRGESGPLGAISVSSHRTDAYDDNQAALLQGLADQAAITIQNARLIAKLERSQAALETRAETERSLRDITARITSLRDPEEILARVVEESRRLLRSDGAHLTRMADDGTYLVPVIVAGGMDSATEAWLKGMTFPLGNGINGLAAEEVHPIWTYDYALDPRIPHEPDDVVAAERLGLRGMAAAPLRAPGGEVIGTLAVSYGQPREFAPDELDLLQGLADQAAIALTNSNLYELLGESEARYRHLVQNSPELVWSIDADARFSFISDTCERLTGWRPEDLLGKYFGALVHESSADVTRVDWTAALLKEHQELRVRLNLLHRDGHPIPAEFSAVGTVDEEGRFAGANGSVRDMREQDRLERELRESEERYRFLVENAPDVVFTLDEVGRFAFLSETMARMTGFQPAELVGKHFSEVVTAATVPNAAQAWDLLVADPAHEQVVQLDLRRKGGGTVPVEVSSIGTTVDGRFQGIHGATRDISERVRLEQDLRRQAGELASSQERAHLARELHDSVTQALFSMTLVTRSTELLVDRDPVAAMAKLASLRDLQREALAEMRALIFELRPGNLEQDGLLPALRTHAAALQGRIGLPILVSSDVTDRLPLALEEVLYRIAQEALHNVVKHAGARQVTLSIGRSGADVRLRIVDDGRGFQTGSVPDGHLGLAGMRARAEKVGATFGVTSRPGSGTTIEVMVPEEIVRGMRETSPSDAGTDPTVSSAE
jgi:PAS domain S-box-containing protein